MTGETNETVGVGFNRDLLQIARDKTLEVTKEAAALVRPGMTEKDAKKIIQKIQATKNAPNSWHPPQVRFGENTLLGFGKPGVDNQILREEDIFFFDIGPIFDNHEGDVGRPFSIGGNPEFELCCQDAELIWLEVKNTWKENRLTGIKLYEFAKTAAQKRGWILSLEKANGHRIADFPHAVHIRGNIEELNKIPQPDRWILEIQIRHPTKKFGAFYEDLLC